MRSHDPKMIRFAAQFAAMYNGEPWYGDSICQILKGISPDIAFWQPTDNAHSIAQITSHMIYWRQSLINRLNGDLDYKSSMTSEDNWRSSEQLKKQGWKSILKSLDQSHDLLLALLVKQKDSILNKRYSDKASYQDLINGILQHDLYHTGQIAYLKSIYHNKKK